jgi:hypothetical protein
VLSSDEEVFGGWRNLSKETDGEHHTQNVSGLAWFGAGVVLLLRPSRCGVWCKLLVGITASACTQPHLCCLLC